MSDEDVDKFLLIIDPLNKNKFTFILVPLMQFLQDKNCLLQQDLSSYRRSRSRPWPIKRAVVPV